MLIFGGSKFSEKRGIDPGDYNDQCFKLSILPNSSTFQLKQMPGAKLRCPDKFFNNMQVRCDVN